MSRIFRMMRAWKARLPNNPVGAVFNRASEERAYKARLPSSVGAV